MVGRHDVPRLRVPIRAADGHVSQTMKILVHVRDGGCNMPPRFVGEIGNVAYEASRGTRHDFQVTTGAVKAQFAALS
jgi:hypothetical protein